MDNKSVIQPKAELYVIQLGSDFMCYENCELFHKNDAEAFLFKVIEGLQIQLKSVNKEEADEAWSIITNLRILPYWSH